MLALLLLGLNARPALAHGGATLTVSPSVVAPGEAIRVEGEGVEPGEEFTITLEGMDRPVPLGTVLVGDDGDFHEEFTVPADIRPGPYQVRAVSAEGETLTAELVISADAPAPSTPSSVEPSAEPMALDRSKAPWEMAVIVIGLVISAGAGLLLIRP